MCRRPLLLEHALESLVLVTESAHRNVTPTDNALRKRGVSAVGNDGSTSSCPFGPIQGNLISGIVATPLQVPVTPPILDPHVVHSPGPAQFDTLKPTQLTECALGVFFGRCITDRPLAGEVIQAESCIV
jgi:hypothetical protein